MWRPPPSDADDAAALTSDRRRIARRRRQRRRTSRRSDARRLADALEAVVKAGTAASRGRREALVPGLKTMLGQVSDSLKAAAGHRRQHAGGLRGRLDRGRRHRPHPGLSQGHQQRSRGAVGLFRSGAERGAAGHRRAHLHPGIRQDHRGRLRGSGRPVLPGHHHSSGAGAAQPA